MLTRSIYLQQDLVSAFVTADTDSDRFNVMSRMIGTGEVTALEEDLAKSKKAWTTFTNQRQSVLEDARSELTSLKSRKERLSKSMEDSDLPDKEAWDKWWESVKKLELAESMTVPDVDTSSIAPLDRAVNLLTHRSNSISDKKDTIAEIQDMLSGDRPQYPEDLSELELELAPLLEDLKKAQDTLESARKAAAEDRKEKVIEQESANELAALAQLALRHLGSRCPVCDQSYDPAATRARLEGLMKKTGLEREEGSPDIASSAKRVQELEAAEATLRTVMGKERLQKRRYEEWIKHRNRLLEELDTQADPEETLATRLDDLARRIEKQHKTILDLLKMGEQFIYQISIAGQETRLKEIEERISDLTSTVKAMEAEKKRRDEAGETAQQIIDALREATSALVERKLELIEPIAQSIYSRIDPHPAMRSISLSSHHAYGKGRIETEIIDHVFNVRSSFPGAVLSSSQLNAYALSLFVALNLGLRTTPLSLIMLDDPLQSLDDINLLGVADLLRRLRAERQVFISTHEQRLWNLLVRKLRPIGEDQRTLVLSFSDWSREGPKIEVVEVEASTTKLQIVA